MRKSIVYLLIMCILLFSFFTCCSVESRSDDAIPLSTIAPATTFTNGLVFYNDTSTTYYYITNVMLSTNYIFILEEYTEGAGLTTLNPGDQYSYASTCAITSNPAYVAPPDPVPPEEPTSNKVLHTHDWVEGVIYEASQIADGLEGIYCKSCGAIKESWPISAYAYSLNDYATSMINTSKTGQTITFEFGEWNSFPKAFMEKIAVKSAEGVTFVFHYKWNHVKQEITIPAGTAVDLNFDYYGPAKMNELYGLF